MRKLFVMGGGGFAMEPENPLLDQYILSLSEKERPKVCFIGTANGDSEDYRNRFLKAYGELSCEPSFLSLFKPPTRDLGSFINEKDILHVGGGNTKNLLCLWRGWGLDKIIKQAYQRGMILSGMSAGMICWFEQGITDSFGDGLEALECLGFLEGSACPHFDGESERRPAYLSLIKQKRIFGGLALEDGCGALFQNEKLEKCVSSRRSARGFVFDANATERILETEFLGR